MPPERIIDDIRDNLDCENLETPIALTTKKDIRNISRKFNLNKASLHANDAISVDVWCQSMKNLEDQSQNPVVFYKPQGKPCSKDLPLDEDDFMLILSTPFQKSMIKKFGSKIVCIDSTHGTNKYNFYLTTLVIIDEYKYGNPGAFCFSNKKDTLTWEIFYSKLQEDPAIGNISPNVFMSDDDPAFYNAWVNIMGPVMHKLLCTWHVDRSWQKNLPKITNVDKRDAVYKTLRVLLQEMNEERFRQYMNAFMTQLLEDQETNEFEKYFRSTYSERSDQWAYCFRKNCEINTNMYLEAMHKSYKYFHLHAVVNNRLDKCIFELLRFARNCYFKRVHLIGKKRLSRNQGSILKSHEKSSEVKSIQSFNDYTWSVQSFKDENIFYKVTLTLDNVESCSNECVIVCTKCLPRICIHTFHCECINYNIQHNICKHIHACVPICVAEISQNESSYTNFNDKSISSDNCQPLNEPAYTFQSDHNNISNDVQELKLVLPKKKPSNSLTSLKTKLQTAQGFLEINEDQYSEDQILNFHRIVDNLLKQIGTKQVSATSKLTSTEPCNKKVVKQRNFILKSTLKKKNHILVKTPNQQQWKLLVLKKLYSLIYIFILDSITRTQPVNNFETVLHES